MTSHYLFISCQPMGEWYMYVDSAKLICRLGHGGLYRWRENSLSFFLKSETKRDFD